MREMALFAVIRLALWAAIWWALTLSGVGVLLAGVLAALIAMLLSILFLDRLRSGAALRWKAADDRRRARKHEVHDLDAEAEDAYLDGDGDGDGDGEGEGVSGADDDPAGDAGSVPDLGDAGDDAGDGDSEVLDGPDGKTGA